MALARVRGCVRATTLFFFYSADATEDLKHKALVQKSERADKIHQSPNCGDEKHHFFGGLCKLLQDI